MAVAADQRQAIGRDTLLGLHRRMLEHLDAAPRLLSADDTPIPYATPLEEAWLPSVDRIAAAIQALARE